MSELFEAVYLDCSTDIGLEDEHKDLLAKPLENNLFEQVYRETKLREMVTVESGRIYISQTEEDKSKNINELWKYYENYAIQQIKTNKKWQSVTVENTESLLNVEIHPAGVQEILSHTPKQERFRAKILCLQAIPHMIQKMHHITLELERKNRNQNEYWYK